VIAIWHTVNRAVIGYGTATVDDPDRIRPVTTLGLDETAFVRLGPTGSGCGATSSSATASCSTSSQAVTPLRRAIGSPGGHNRTVEGRHQVGDPGPGRSYRSVADTMLPDAQQVADPFHVVRAANERLDEVRRRVQQQQVVGHRGRKADPLYYADLVIMPLCSKDPVLRVV
jgi:transposase